VIDKARERSIWPWDDNIGLLCKTLMPLLRLYPLGYSAPYSFGEYVSQGMPEASQD